MTVSRSAALVGASGLVGGHLLSLLAADPAYERVVVLTRRALGVRQGKVTEQVVDFDDPAALRRHLGVSHVFCCLGTTIKKAGSQEAFRKVDCEIPLAVAREARAAGALRYVIVTAVGASSLSSVFYNRVKGEVEEGLGAIGFPEGVDVVRPSILLGERTESRPGEGVATAVVRAAGWMLVGGLARYRAIPGADVARAMQRAAATIGGGGVRFYEGASLFSLSAPAGAA